MKERSNEEVEEEEEENNSGGGGKDRLGVSHGTNSCSLFTGNDDDDAWRPWIGSLGCEEIRRGWWLIMGVIPLPLSSCANASQKAL